MYIPFHHEKPFDYWTHKMLDSAMDNTIPIVDKSLSTNLLDILLGDHYLLFQLFGQQRNRQKQIEYANAFIFCHFIFSIQSLSPLVK